MNAPQNIPVALGLIFEGGFYAGRIKIGEQQFAILSAPKEGGETEMAWGKLKKVEGVMNFFDGVANTQAMAAAGSKLATWAQGLTISGYSDWYIPSRDELELCYRNLKPTRQENWCFRGDNPSSVPAGYAYMPKVPAQTEIEEFRDGGTQAFDDTWYWSSTQFAGDAASAWVQGFGDGNQSYGPKGIAFRCRAVRRVAI